MYAYIKGNIVEQMGASVILECHNIGYLINVPNPYIYEIDKDYKIYIHEHIREDEYSLYGFKNPEELELFLKLLDVKGIGPRMALPILATGSISGIVDAIERENILYLTKFPKIGEKLARQIILDLKGKLTNLNGSSLDSQDDLISVLDSLGYKTNDIKKIIPQIDKTLPIETQIKEALKLLLK